MQIYAPLMAHQLSALTNNKIFKGNPFQILGIDVLVDEKGKAWVLEINDHPSLNIYFDKEFMNNVKKPSEDDICPVDLYVKSRLVTDVIDLCCKSPSKIADIDCHNSLTRIIPDSQHEVHELHTLMQGLRRLFYKSTPIKNKTYITSG